MRNVKVSSRPNALTFQEWCHSVGGLQQVALLAGVSYQSVQNWYYVKSNPSVPMMQRLIYVSENQLTYESIIDSTQPNHKRGA